jgi:hypothetical protein
MATSCGSFGTLFSLGFGFEAYCCCAGVVPAHFQVNSVSAFVKLVLYDPQVASACVCTMSELHQAVLKSDLDAVKLLLCQTSLEVNARDLSGALAFTPLHLAARRGDVKVLSCLLLDPRVDIEARDATKCTALRHAMGTGQLAAASKCLQHHLQQFSHLMLLSWLLLLLMPVANADSSRAAMPLAVKCSLHATCHAITHAQTAWVATNFTSAAPPPAAACP